MCLRHKIFHAKIGDNLGGTMNIYVCVKHVPDTEAKIVPKGIDEVNLSNVKWIISPYDEYAIEEAVSTASKIDESEVVVVTFGPDDAQKSIRQALAMGAHRALHVVCDAEIDHKYISQSLACAIKKDGDFGIIFTGKQASDDDSYQVHLRIAHELNASCSTNVVGFKFDGSVAVVVREIDDGASEKIKLTLPAVVAVSKGINDPRYPTLPNIMKAKKKEIKKLSLDELGVVNVSNCIEVTEHQLPVEKTGGEVLSGTNDEMVTRLVNTLISERKVIS